MRASKRIISKTIIEKEIYNTFEQFKKTKSISIAEYLKHFDTSLFELEKYRKIKFTYESLIKLVLYQQLKGIKFYTKLTKYLRRNPKDKFRLGFSNTPDRTSIGHFVNQILDDKIKELLEFTVSKILSVSEKFGCLFDVKTLQPEKPTKETKDRNQYILEDKKIREICKLFKKRISPFINLNLGKNCVYKKKAFIDLLIYLGIRQFFAEGGSKDFKLKRDYSPDADTLLYHLSKYSSVNELQKMFISVYEVLWEMARQANIINIRKKVTCAIDFTEQFYYGSKNTPMTVGKQPERGTSSCYKFATISIVDSGKRFVILALPYWSLHKKEEIITKLLSYALQRIRIKRVLLDRGFFDSRTINTINHFHLPYLMPAMQIYSVRRVMELSPAPSIVKGFRLKNVGINLVIADDDEGVKRVFATNENFNENEVNLAASKCFQWYSQRWSIETTFRVLKHSYWAKTTSKNYLIRLFYFLFSILLYNLWILADVLIWLYLFGFVGDSHKVTSLLFGDLLLIIDPGG